MLGFLEALIALALTGFCGYLLKRLNGLWSYAEQLELELGIHIENTIASEVETALAEIREVLGESGAVSLDPFDMIELQKQQMIAGAFGKIAEYIGNRLNAPMGVHTIEAPLEPAPAIKSEDL